LPGDSFTAGLVRLSSARFGSARHGTENTPLRLRLRNRGAYFVVTILVWRKYATLSCFYIITYTKVLLLNVRESCPGA
jgi:hypothetical protein